MYIIFHQGDSGGPVICNDVKRLVGTLSFGLECDGSTPSVNTRTSAYLDWIKTTINTNGNKQNNKDKKDKKEKKIRKARTIRRERERKTEKITDFKIET